MWTITAIVSCVLRSVHKQMKYAEVVPVKTEKIEQQASLHKRKLERSK